MPKRHDPKTIYVKCVQCNKTIKVKLEWSALANKYVETVMSPIESIGSSKGYACSYNHYMEYVDNRKD